MTKNLNKEAMKELISEEEILWFIQQETGVKYKDITDALFSEQVIYAHISKWNKRHEKAMTKAKEIAFKAWSKEFKDDDEAIDYFFGSKENMRKAFDEWYDKKYETFNDK